MNILKIRNKKGWVLVFGLLGIVITAQLIVSNLAAGKGHTLATLEAKAVQISRENQNLQEALSQSSSLTKLAQDAAGSGFAKPENIMYLEASLLHAAKPVAQASQ